MLKKIKLTKVSSNTNALRTNEIIGTCAALPEVGFHFVMYSDGIEFGTRIVQTSLVQEINGDLFKTENSEYKLEQQ